MFVLVERFGVFVAIFVVVLLIIVFVENLVCWLPLCGWCGVWMMFVVVVVGMVLIFVLCDVG